MNSATNVTINGTTNVTCTVVGINGAFEAYIILHLDGSHWANQTVELYRSDSWVTMTGGNGVYEVSIGAGEYKIYVNGGDTEITLTVTTSGFAIVEYFTVTFYAIDSGTADGSTVTSLIDDGDPVLKGTVLTFTANGAGVAGAGAYYVYFWSDSTMNSATNVTINGTTNVTCTVIGVDGAFEASVSMHLDGAHWANQMVELYRSGDFITVMNEGKGAYIASVPAGTYEIYVKGKDTGIMLEVSATGSAVAEFFTVTFSALDSGTARGSTVTSSIDSGTPVLKGTVLTFTVHEAGAAGTGHYYVDIWSNSTMNTTTNVTINATTNVTCTVFGIDGAFEASVILRLDGARWGNQTVELYQHEIRITVMTPGNNNYVATVSAGAYEIYVNGEDTGIEITVTTAGSATVRYFTVSGTVSAGGTGLSGVDITYTVGDGPDIVISTDADGRYTMIVQEGSTAVIIDMRKDGYDPAPGTLPSTYNATATANFVMLKDFYVSGKVFLKDTETGIEGVTVEYTIDGVPGSVVTDVNGNYTIIVQEGSTVIIVDLRKDGHVPAPGALPSETYDAAAVLDFVMLNEFYVSGKVFLKGTETGIEGVTVEYMIDGVPGSVVTDANGNYTISAGIGETVIITNIWKDGYAPAPGTLPSTYDATAVADLVMLNEFYISGTVLLKGTETGIEGVTIEYTIDGVPGSVVTDVNGNYTISAGIGKTVIKTNIWKNGHVLISDILTEFRDAIDVVIEMEIPSSDTDDTPGTDDDGSLLMPLILIISLAAVFTLFLLWFLKREGIGTVRAHDGKGIGGATIVFTVNGKTKQVKTNKKGEYHISGAKDSEIVITGVTMEGVAIAEGLPVTFTKGERKGKVDFTRKGE
jgi:hypothetical protein